MMIAMLDDDELRRVVANLWRLHVGEHAELDRVHGYVRGKRGIPSVPEGASAELAHLARLSVKNVLALVVNSFAQNLAVVGYRAGTDERNAAAWRLWQAQGMDARQAEVYRAALTYGASYVTVVPTVDGLRFRPRSPRQLIAVYADPTVDAWPQYALETWVDYTDARPTRRGLLLDAEAIYPVNLGELTATSIVAHEAASTTVPTVRTIDEPYRHGAGVCPVVRFVNDRDSEDLIRGEVEPLIELQRAINEVNFDRLVVSRFGAFPQRYVIGWTSDDPTEVLRTAMSRTWTFDDDNVRVGDLSQASVEPYNALLGEMLEHVATVAQISPAQITGKMVQLTAEALAAAEAVQHRKLDAKRDSFGESWEQVLRLGAAMDGDPATAADESASVRWRDTEARSFGAVVDGVVKLIQVGVPAGPLLPLIKGLTEQQIRRIEEDMAGGGDMLAELRALAGAPSNGDGADGFDPSRL